ncbi:MAG: flagellar basal body-associated FliL family protein [Lachnospiraceae bacterium]|nr:flagellar basal body-associated FliL family protein [Lachnospiraceae bacterium]
MMTLIILALLLVNVVMTGVMMFVTVPANRKTIELVDKISSAIDLDMGTAVEPASGVKSNAGVSMENLVTYSFEDQMTVKLKPDPTGEDTKDHFVMVGVVLSMDSTNPDYETIGKGGDLSSSVGIIKDEINKIISSYTYDEISTMSTTEIQDKILERLQELYNSNFIVGVSFSTWLPQ